MTTTVTVQTHDWPVKVVCVDSNGNTEHETEEVIPPHTTRNHLVIHQTRTMHLIELEKPNA